MLHKSKTHLRLSLGFSGDLHNMITKGSLHNAQRTHRIVDHVFVERRNHSAIGKPIKVATFVLRAIGVVFSSHFSIQVIVVLRGFQLSQQLVSLSFGFLFGSNRVLATHSTLITNQDVAGTE